MIQVAFLNLSGEIHHWITPGNDSMYADGYLYDGYTAKHLSAFYDIKTYSKTNYWNFSTNSWAERIAQPSHYYRWENNTWIFYKPELLEDLRVKRNSKLYSCDWTQLLDCGLSEEKVEEWRTYRQELRDYIDIFSSTSANDLSDAVWPTEPS